MTYIIPTYWSPYFFRGGYSVGWSLNRLIHFAVNVSTHTMVYYMSAGGVYLENITYLCYTSIYKNKTNAMT